MKPPKQKPKMGKPKIIEKTLRTPDCVRGVSSKMNKHIPDGENKNINEYASDNVTEKGEYATRKGIETTTNTGKKAVKKGYNMVKERIRTRESKQDNQENNSFGVNSSNSKNPYNENTKTDIKHKQAQHGKTAQAKNTYKTNSRANEIKNNKLIDKNVRKAKTKQSSVNKKPNVKGKATVKTSRNTVKKTQKSIKTAQNISKRTVKTTQKSVKAAKRSTAIAKNAAKVSVRAVKLTAKAIITAVRSAIAAIKGLIAGIAVGGWIVVVMILVIALIVALASSPWGIFFEDTDDNTPPISELVVQLNNEFSGEVTSIISNAGEINEIIMDSDSDVIQYKPVNLVDVIGIFSVKTAANPDEDAYMDVLIMDDTKVNILREVFWDMNTISFEVLEEPIPTPVPSPTITPSEPIPTLDPDVSPTPEPTPEIYRTLIISIESKTYEQGAELYNFNDEQNKLLEELMSSDYYTMFIEICGMNSFNGLTPEQAAQLINDLPEGYLGSMIVEYAISRLGDPYSQSKRGQGSYVDCSYLARWCYLQSGVSHFTAGTAAEQARYCVNNNLTIAKSALQPGDLVFWSFNTNGRFMNITHVGIYAGNGMVIDASSSRGMVVYREIFGSASQVLYGRPYVK